LNVAHQSADFVRPIQSFFGFKPEVGLGDRIAVRADSDGFNPSASEVNSNRIHKGKSKSLTPALAGLLRGKKMVGHPQGILAKAGSAENS
jgi:hypothetical protein